MLPTDKTIHIYGGGTIQRIDSHLALCAPAQGGTARALAHGYGLKTGMNVHLHLTKMAGGQEGIDTNGELRAHLWKVVEEPATKIVVMTCAICDFSAGSVWRDGSIMGNFSRLPSRWAPYRLDLQMADKVIGDVRKMRKDIFCIGFSQTFGETKEQMFLKAQRLMKDAHLNLVVANDTKTRLNFVATPEESIYGESVERNVTLQEMIDISLLRCNLTFTQSTVVAGEAVPWTDSRVPLALRAVIEHCVGRSAYKAIDHKTAGHFAVKVSDTEFLTSIRKSNLNDIRNVGLVYIRTDGPDTVIAYGSKPSVGGQSQRIVFRDHPGMDCIVHFHCPLKPGSEVPVVSQREYECGSHQCGQNTSQGLKEFCGGQILAVMLDNHGPNIVFSKSIDPALVIGFIEQNFDLSAKTGPAWDQKK